MLTNDLFLNRKPQNENKMFPRGASGYWQKKVEDGFILMWCNFKFDGILFNLETYRRM
jgi:hypothetical protein